MNRELDSLGRFSLIFVHRIVFWQCYIKVFLHFLSLTLALSSIFLLFFFWFLSFFELLFTLSKRTICFVSRNNRITQGHVINYVACLVFVVLIMETFSSFSHLVSSVIYTHTNNFFFLLFLFCYHCVLLPSRWCWWETLFNWWWNWIPMSQTVNVHNTHIHTDTQTICYLNIVSEAFSLNLIWIVYFDEVAYFKTLKFLGSLHSASNL